jgi:hypothetical protein
MSIAKPQAREVKAPGSSTKEVVEPGVTFSYNIVLDKAGSTAIVQFHLPIGMDEEKMQTYTRKVLGVVELEQLRLDRNKLKVELKLSSAMLESLKEEFSHERAKSDEEAKRSGNSKLAKPKNQQLIAMDNNYRNASRRHESMVADLAQMEKRLAVNSSADN